MSCRGCIYKAKPRSVNKCNYLLITGHSRGCPIEGCTVKQTKGAAQRSRPRPVALPGSLPKITTGQHTPQNPGHKVTFNEAAALELYHKGMSDAKIAAELGGISPNGIAAWRKRKLMPSQRRKKKEAI